MLSAEKIFNIATILLNNGYIPAESPNSLVKLFKWYSETKIDEIFKRTEITKNELYMFFNQTIPCLVNTTQNFSNTHNDAVVLKKIVEIWYGNLFIINFCCLLFYKEYEFENLI